MTEEKESQLAPQSTIRPVPLHEELEEGRKRCGVCEYRCTVEPGREGVCKIRINRDGQLLTVNYGVVSRADLELIEARGFVHFFPSAKIFSVGGYGQNFPSVSGQNIFDELPSGQALRSLPLERLARFPIDQHCRGVLFTYNEPSMWFEYLLDAAKTIKANGMFTAMATNGYMTTEALEMVGHYMDGVRVEVNAFTERTFMILTGQTQFQKVLESATRAQKRFKAHVEISSKLVPGVNDSPDELRRLIGWIRLALGENTPWHISCALPDSDDILWNAKILGEHLGLHYIYARELKTPRPVSEQGSEVTFDTTSDGNTYCYKCHELIIKRTGDVGNETRIIALEGSKCGRCHTELNIHNTIWKL
ncbi:MAG: radical SAM protein [Chloroflexi bacterium]|nr:radical SAM protein [Chloroflexota bacterium]